MRRAELSAADPGNAVHLYEETARCHPDRTALETSGRTLTHAELRDRSARFAGGLRDVGLEPGDRLALYAPNGSEFVVAALAAFGAGTPFVPMNPQYRSREIAYQLDDSSSEAVVVHESLAGRVESAVATTTVDPTIITFGGGSTGDGSTGDYRFDEVRGDPLTVDREPDDVALQPYTSGTTGPPKGVLLTHRNVRAQSLIGFERTALDAEAERFLSVLPLSHIAGFVNRTLQPLVRGASVHLRDPAECDPETILSIVESESITKFGAVTAMYVDIVNHESFTEYDLSSLEEAMEGGAKMPAAVQRRFEAVAGVELFEAYGLTETGGGTHAGFGATFGPKHGTVGQPLRATDCKVVDGDGEEVPPGETGELLVRGPHVMAGYHDRPEATAAAFTERGYFRTGDVARRDADGYYEVVDRKSDVIVTAGYNVYPREVEEVLHEHEGVLDAAVVGVPDERRNETVKAYVVANPAAEPTGERLREHCLDELAAYKHPREVEFVEALPRTASGKVKKFELPEAASD